MFLKRKNLNLKEACKKYTALTAERLQQEMLFANIEVTALKGTFIVHKMSFRNDQIFFVIEAEGLKFWVLGLLVAVFQQLYR